MNRTIMMIMGLVLAIAAAGGARVEAAQCDDYDECTANDMCLPDGECSGTPLTGPGCDDGNECTVNDSCKNGVCTGTPVAAGSVCGKGCGKCMAGGFCMTDPALEGKPCEDDFGACTTGDHCMFGFCLFGSFVECPDTDSNPCTFDWCIPATGACQHFDFPPCSECETCRVTGSGPDGYTCDAVSDGSPCDDYNECTGDGGCFEGMCEEGPPQTPNATLNPTYTNTPGQVPTSTRTNPPVSTATPTATKTATVTRTPTTPGAPTRTPGGISCAGDCNGDGSVTVDELIKGVNIALGVAPVEDCPAFDTSGNGSVTIDELIAAVNNALTGCPAA